MIYAEPVPEWVMRRAIGLCLRRERECENKVKGDGQCAREVRGWCPGGDRAVGVEGPRRVWAITLSVLGRRHVTRAARVELSYRNKRLTEQMTAALVGRLRDAFTLSSYRYFLR